MLDELERPLTAPVQAPPIILSRETKRSLTLTGLRKDFGRFPALNEVSLEVRAGELLALLGPSGSGKTTLLRLIAGLDFPDAGTVAFDGQDVTFRRAAERGVGFVFQHYALFKHMSVAKNIAFGLDVRSRRERPSKAERMARVEALLELVQLKGLGDRYPAQLSGGQRQRVALARALAVEPRILLLDEPFGALDATVRKTLRHELRRIHEATGVTTVFVTHDQDEALELADRVAVLNAGRIEQVGSPEEVVERPASLFVAGFVGQANRLSGQVYDGTFFWQGAELAAPGFADGPAVAFVRPDQLAPAAYGPVLHAAVKRITPRGAIATLQCAVKGGAEMLEVAIARSEAGTLAIGQVMALKIIAGQMFARAG